MNLTTFYKHEKIFHLQGYEYPYFQWDLHFKPENRYLTSEGFPLGTTCWYIRCTACGKTSNYCADPAEEAIEIAIAKTIAEIEKTVNEWDELADDYRYKPSADTIDSWKTLLEKIKAIARVMHFFR